MLCVVGDLLTDVIVRLKQSIVPGSDAAAEIRHTRGGSAANVAAAVVASGGRARFIGQVGDDQRGTDLVDELEAIGVQVFVQRNGTTGTVVAMVDETGERSFLTDRSAAIARGPIDPKLLNEVTWLHIPAYSFADGPLADSTHQFVGDAIERKIPVSLSTSSTSMLREFGISEFHELVETISPNVVLANGPEANLLLGPGYQFPGAVWSVITNGASPTVITHHNGEQRRIEPPAATVRDATGAGDAFAAGFLHSLSTGGQPLDAVRAGHELAHRTLHLAGAQIEDH